MIHWFISILQVRRKIVFIELYQLSDTLLDVLHNKLSLNCHEVRIYLNINRLNHINTFSNIKPNLYFGNKVNLVMMYLNIKM